MGGLRQGGFVMVDIISKGVSGGWIRGGVLMEHSIMLGNHL